MMWRSPWRPIPPSADAARFADYRAAGVNRVSLGVQALNDADLKKLGRLHDVAEAKAALKMAMGHFEPGFTGFDLCPARSKRRAMARRIEGGACPSAPITCRSISSPSSRKRLTPCCTETASCGFPDDDLAAGLYETTQELTRGRGPARL